jgi:hypothetical protein
MSDRNLRASLIRLAYQNPSLRPTLLPLLKKRAGGPDEPIYWTKGAALEIARAVAGALDGVVGAVEAREEDGWTTASVPVVVPDLPAIDADDGSITVTVSGFPEALRSSFSYYGAPRRQKDVARGVSDLGTGDSFKHYPSMEGLVSAALRDVPKLSALLTPVRAAEAMRRTAAVAFKAAVPEMKEWLQAALVHSGVVGPVKVWGHPVGGATGTGLTDEGTPYAAEALIIEGLIGKDEGRDIKRSQEVLANTRKVLTKALSRFFHKGVAAKLSSKPASWNAYAYNTTVILYFKDAPVENMKLGG